MKASNYLYDFGVAQDDPQTELRVLKPVPGDRILCIASAGEVPLELLVHCDFPVAIDAVDISKSQLFLSHLKLQAALHLENWDAARFLGFIPAEMADRIQWFESFVSALPENETIFWKKNAGIFSKGPIHLGRYETHIARFAPFGRWLLGGKERLLGLFDCRTIEEQQSYFDEKLRTGLLKKLFKLMFHPRIYKKHGISEQGLQHMGDDNIGITFYRKFRDFCTATPVRENWILQFVLFDEVIIKDALPFYLHPEGKTRLGENCSRLQFMEKSYTEMIEVTGAGHYNKFALSNVSDWLSEAAFTELLQLITDKGGKNAKGLIRYIHSAGISEPELKEYLGFDLKWGEQLLRKDRFPFYNLIPFEFNTAGHE